MQPITASVTIAKPREEVFAYLADIANHAEFTDHYLVDWHLTREDSVGLGAGARFRVTAPLTRFPWGDVTITELEAPRLLVERGRSGKFNRIQTLGVYELEPAPAGGTRVTFTFQSQLKTPSDRFLESLGAAGWLKRKNGRALRRLKAILEEGLDRGERPTISGGARGQSADFHFDASRLHAGH